MIAEDLPAELEPRTKALVWHQKLDEFIEHHLGRPWRCQQGELWGQGTLHELYAGKDRLVTTLIEEWLASPPAMFPGRFPDELGTTSWNESVLIDTEDLLSELCNRGLLKEGEINIHCWW